MHFMAPDGKRHRFIIFALMYPRARSRPQAQAAEKLQKLRVFLIDAEDLDGFTGVHFGERHGAALPAQLCQATDQGYSVRQELSGPKRSKSSASTSGEIPCSSRSASSCAFDHSRPITSVRSFSANWWRSAKCSATLRPLGVSWMRPSRAPR